MIKEKTSIIMSVPYFNNKHIVTLTGFQLCLKVIYYKRKKKKNQNYRLKKEKGLGEDGDKNIGTGNNKCIKCNF